MGYGINMRIHPIGWGDNMQCPFCNSKLGIISRKKFFCKNCCFEVHVEGNNFVVYRIEFDGSTSKLCTLDKVV